MRLIDNFVEKAFTATDSFTILEEGSHEKDCFFVPTNVGTAKFIYGTYSWYDHQFYASPDTKLKLVAIVASNTVYVVDELFLEVTAPYRGYEEPEKYLPPHTKYLTGELLERFNDIKNNLLPKYSSSLQAAEITDENTIYKCRKEARKILLHLKEKEENPYHNCVNHHVPFKMEDLIKIMCGFLDYEEELKRRMDEVKETLTGIKSRSLLVSKLLTDASIAEPCEISLANALSDIEYECKNVTIHFECDGLTGVAKMQPKAILERMVDNSCFRTYDFESYSEWELLGKDLNFSNIAKITYRKKTLYEKKIEE